MDSLVKRLWHRILTGINVPNTKHAQKNPMTEQMNIWNKCCKTDLNGIQMDKNDFFLNKFQENVKGTDR